MSGECRGCGTAKRGMRSLGVGVLYPVGEDCTGLTDREEQRLVEQFVAHATIEALYELVLRRLARRDVVPLDANAA